jgi:hypothetical protein
MADGSCRFCGARLAEPFSDLDMSPFSNSFVSPGLRPRATPRRTIEASVRSSASPQWIADRRSIGRLLPDVRIPIHAPDQLLHTQLHYAVILPGT